MADDEEDSEIIEFEETDKLLTGEPVKLSTQAEVLKAELAEIEKELQTDPENEETIKKLENTLIDAKLFSSNVAKEGSEAEEVIKTKRAISLIEDGANALDVIRAYNEYIFPILGRKKYKFGQKWLNSLDYKKKMIKRLQLENVIPNPAQDMILNKPSTGPNTMVRKITHFFNVATTLQRNDMNYLNGGFPGLGKSTLSLLMMFALAEERQWQMTFKAVCQYLKEKVIYTEDPAFKHEILRLEDDIRIIDEGFFMIFNEETMKRTMRELTKNLYSARSRRNIYIFNMSDLSMATKPFQKRILPYSIITRVGQTKFLCRSKLPVSAADPLGLKPLEDTQDPDYAERLITHNPNFIASFRFGLLPGSKLIKKEVNGVKITQVKEGRIEKEYQKNKKIAQMDKADIDRSREENDKETELLILDGIAEYESGTQDLITYFTEMKFRRPRAKQLADEVLFRIRKRDALREKGLLEEDEVDG